MIRVSLVEDHGPSREAWAAILAGTPGFRCVSTHASAEDALKNLPRDQADVLLVDLGLPGRSGIELIRELKRKPNRLLCCVLTQNEDAERIFESLQAGATGYLIKKTRPAEVLESLTELVNGGAAMSPAVARKVVESFHRLPGNRPELDQLSPREMEILQHIAQGLPDKQIAEKLKISPHTVRNHVASIYAKLQVNTRVAAAEKLRTR